MLISKFNDFQLIKVMVDSWLGKAANTKRKRSAYYYQWLMLLY